MKGNLKVIVAKSGIHEYGVEKARASVLSKKTKAIDIAKVQNMVIHMSNKTDKKLDIKKKGSCNKKGKSKSHRGRK